MGTNTSSAAESSPPKKRISGRRVRLNGQDGQSLIIVTLAMFVVLLISGFAIDLAQWYQKHHQAQVAADSAALAAANYMAKGGAVGTATSTATTFAGANGIPISSSNVTVDTTADAVTVTVPTHASTSFASVIGINPPAVSTRAVAQWTAPGAPYSLFAGNSTCGSGLGFSLTSKGGGGQAVSGLFSNGQFTIDSDSNGAINGSFAYDETGSPPYCGGNTTSVKNGTITDAGTAAIPYPETYTQPAGAGCTHSAPYFTTSTSIGNGNNAVPVPSLDQITTPGVYCVTAAFNDSQGCADGYNQLTATGGGNSAGWIYVGSSLTGAYEFVAPCVTLAAASTGLTAPTGAPLVYGTSNTGTAASVPTGTPICTNSSNATPSTWLDSNNVTLSAPLYDQCGTVKFTGNSVTFNGFVEAANIVVGKNNGITGTGPTPTFENGNDELTQ